MIDAARTLPVVAPEAFRLRRRVRMFAVTAALLAGCENLDLGAESLCSDGTLGCPCAPIAQCDPGLVCEADLCVAPPPTPDAVLQEVIIADITSATDTSDAPAPVCGQSPEPNFCECRENADCASGYCVPSRDGGSVCTPTCTDSCQEGWRCAFVQLPNADPTYLCVQSDLNLCRPCTADSQCQAGTFGADDARCVTYGEAEGSFCGLACEDDETCPDSYACREVTALETGTPTRQCVLADDDATCGCSGRATAAGAFTYCQVGRCEGARVCREDGLEPCTDPDGELCLEDVPVLVTFDVQGGTQVSPESMTFLFDAPYGQLPDTARAGYGFKGWWTEPGGLGELAEDDTVVTRRDPYTLFADWEARTLTVTFDARGGDAPTPGTKSVTFDAPYGDLPATARVGHTFEGWWTTADGPDARVEAASLVAIGEDHTLYARWTPDLVVVTFDPAGGEAPSPRTATVTYGAAYGELATTARAGYTFAGWWTAADGGVRVTPDTAVSDPAAHTLHARWTANSYLVTFDSEGGSGCPSLLVTFGETYGRGGALCTPGRAGYTFEGWFDGDNGTGRLVAGESIVVTAGNHTLHARWVANTCTVTYDSEGGSECAPRDVTFGSSYGQGSPLCTPTRAGHTFGGWHDGDNGTGRRVTGGSEVTTPNNHVLYAKWTANTYAVTFDAEGGTPCDGLTVTYGQPYAAAPFCTPEREGYTFAGWHDGDSGAGDAVTHTTVVAITADQVLHARWTANTYVVTFDNEGGAGCTSATVTFGAPYGEPVPLCVPARPGYLFSGWYDGDNGTGSDVRDADRVTRASDHTLYARWKALAYTLTYDAEGGATCDGRPVTFGALYGTLCTTFRDGYTFAGWHLGDDGTGERVTSDSRVATPRNHTLFARWDANAFTVTYDNEGGAGCTTLSVSMGAAYGAGGPLCTPTRAGYTFGGWYRGDGGTGDLVTEATTVATARDHTLHARWTSIMFNVAFDSEGGSACAARVVIFGTPYGAEGPLCVPTRAGWTFGGWWTGDNGTGTEVTDASPVATPRDHLLFARWTANTYRVTLDAEGGEACAPLTVRFASPYGALCATVRSGHTFGGWWTGDNGTGAEVLAGTFVTTAADHTLHARWTANAYTVTFEAAGGTAPVPTTKSVTYATDYGALAVTTRTGHTFGGWWTAADGGGAEVTHVTPMTRTASHSVFAKWTANRYVLNYDNESGAGCTAREVTFGAAYGTHCQPTRLGHTFGGWWTGDNGTGSEVTATTVVSRAETHTVHARWTANAYGVTYDSEGGTACALLPVTFGQNYGAQAPGGLLCTPTRPGFTFGGWWSGDNGTGLVVTVDSVVTTAGDHTLHARWTARTYTVTYDNQGGSGCSNLVVTFGQPYNPTDDLCVPARSGYSFGGWWSAPGGAGSAVTGETTVTTVGSHTIYAKWTANGYTVRLDARGGSACPDIAVTFGQTYVAGGGALCPPTRVGYTFGGWWTAEAGGLAVTGASLVTTAGDHVLYARWTANGYTVTFDAQGGLATNPSSRTVTFGLMYGPLPLTSRAGHAFGGWWTGPDATGAGIAATTEVTTPEHHTLYASWVANGYVVTYDNEGGAGCATTAVVFGQPYGQSAPLCTPTRAGHTFGGWFLGDNGTGTRVLDDMTVQTAGGHTLHARWTANSYTVSFESRGGTPCAPLGVTFGQTYVAGGGALCTPTREGWTFGGWWESETAGAVRVTGASVVATADNHVLFARWTANTYTVTHDNAGGSGCTSFQVVFGQAYGANGPLCTPSREGWTFEGWTLGATGAGVTGTTEVTTAAHHSLVARWTANTYVVTFAPNGGTSCPQLTVTFDQSYGAASGGGLCEPSRVGHTFGGWWTADGAGTRVTVATRVSIASNHILYARWTADSYAVTFDAGAGTPANPPQKAVTYGTTYGALATTSRTGYTFGSWWTAAEGGGSLITQNSDMLRAEPHTLYARWTANPYTVRFDSEQGVACADLPVTYDAPYGPLCVPTRTGHTFGGWWTGDNGTGNPVGADTVVQTAANHTLYAKWTANTYLVSFDSEGGRACAPISATFGLGYGAPTGGMMCAPTREGFTFGGWFDGDNGTGNQASAGTAVTRAEDHTLFARWTANSYLVTFNSRSGTPCPTLPVVFGQAYAGGGTLCTPTRTGYTFGGWFLAENGTGAAVTGSTLVAVAADHTLFASWTANSYDVSHDSEGGSLCTPFAATFGETYGAAAGGALCTPLRTGWTFGGWWDGDNGTGDLVTEATVMTRPSHHTLHARWTANVYAVSFEAGEGTLPAPPGKTVTFGMLYGGLATTSRVGYNFGGWWTGPGGTAVQVTAQTEVTRAEAHTLHALWTANPYNVNFDSKGGSACVAITVTYDAPYGPLCLPSRTGYTFSGWWSAEDGSGVRVTADTEVSTPGHHTLVARWTANAYTVTFDNGGGMGCMTLAVTYGAAYGAAGPLCVPTRTGHTFGGWWTEPNGTGTLIHGYTLVMTAGDHTLFARWTADSFVVTLDPTGGSACPDLPVTWGQSYGPGGATLCQPVRMGHTFDGWYRDVGATGARVLGSSIVTTTGNHTLFAKWTANIYQVSFDTEGGNTCAPMSVTFGQPYGAATGGTLCQPSRVGHTFVGWFDGDNGTGNPISGTTPVATAADQVLHAGWTANSYTVTFEPAGGSTPDPATRTVSFGATYGELATTSRPGFAFGGWWTAPSGGAIVSSGTQVGLTADQVLYARWVANGYTVTYDNESGAGCASQAVIYGQRYDQNAPLCVPARTGYTFGGWYVGDNGTGAQILGATLVVQQADHTLYAKWTVNSYLVTLDHEGGSGCSGAFSVSFDAVYGPALNCTPVRAGHTFGGWHLGDNGTGAEVAAGTLVATGADHTLHAKWTVDTYTVTFDSEGGSTCGPATIPATYGQLYGASGPWCQPSRTGYAFGGWHEGDNGTGTLVEAGTTMLRTASHTLHARWTPRSFVVSFELGYDPPAGTACPDRTVVFGQAYGALCSRTREGYVFEGWFDGPSQTANMVTAADLVSRAEDHRLYARWSGSMRMVTYEPGPGTLSCSGAGGHTVVYGQTYGGLCGVIHAPGATFAGWYDGVGGTGNLITPQTLVTIDANHTLYGRWQVTVTYDTEGGSACAPASKLAYDGEAYGPLCTPTRPDHAFLGWYDGDNGTGVKIETTTTVTNYVSHTLHAGWLPVTPPGFVAIPPVSNYVVGSPQNEFGRTNVMEDQVTITLTRGLFVQVAEVTQGQWKARSGGVNPSCCQSPTCNLNVACGEENAYDSAPVESISWWSAIGYANALSVAEGYTPCYVLPTSGCSGTWQSGTLNCGAQYPSHNGPDGTVYSCTGYRLPTEYEWEYAARAGTTTATYNGNLATTACAAEPAVDQIGWSCFTAPERARPVKTKALPLGKNAFELYDVIGNVAEWTWDPFPAIGCNISSDCVLVGGTNPYPIVSPYANRATHDGRVTRGGSVGDGNLKRTRSASRRQQAIGARLDYLGLRLVRTKF